MRGAARILVIEDNPTNLELMTYLLNAFGYELLTALDGGEGVDLVRRERPHLILCDVHLPSMDGYEVAHTLKSDADLKDIPLIAVTALAMVGDRDKVLAAGFDSYIAKPIDPEAFVAEVESFLDPNWRRPSLAAAIVEHTPAPALPSKGLRILVVDDSLTNRELIRSTLAPFGYEVVLADNVVDALALARGRVPDLILSDLHMPGQDGLGFLRAVKADPSLRGVPFVFISSSVWGEGDRRAALTLGATRFLLRPIEPENLLRELEECLVK